MLDIRLARLHPAQQAIVESPVRFKVLACGRRFGKTAVAIDLMATHLLDGKSAAYFAPTYRMGSEVWRELRQMLQPLIRHAREEDWRMELLTGGVYEGWSLAQGSGELVRGRKYHYVVVDEAALFESGDVWHGAIRPLLTDYEGGALFASTPRGRNWFWQLYLQGQNPEFSEWQAWQYPTSANPHIKAAEIEAARQGMPERFFRQEYEAVFLDDGGVVFRNVERVCVGNPVSDPHPLAPGYDPHPLAPGYDPHPLTPSPLRREGERNAALTGGYDPHNPDVRGFGIPRGRNAVVQSPAPLHGEGENYSEEVCFFGVDWGRDRDFTCVSVMTRDGRQLWLERFNQIGWEAQRGRVAMLYARYKPNTILAEENSMGSVNIEALRAEGLPVRGFVTTAKSKPPLIDELALAMEREEVVLLNDPILKHELLAYEMNRTSRGWSYSAPTGTHDDTVMATALSLWASRRYGWPPISFA